jgi:SAM-dependent methyltransferase
MVADFGNILGRLSQYTVKPPLFTPSEPAGTLFWDDPHISKGMLDAHLDPLHEAASRPPETIDREVNNLLSPGLLKKGDKVLDLGCGPGLYAVRLAAKELKVTGVDLSERSLNYAIAQARKYGFNIEFRLMSFFNLDYTNEFDGAFQAFGEIGTFSYDARDALLEKIRTALKPGGIFVFDVTTPDLKHFNGSQNNWYLADGGFWRPGRHLTLELRFDYPEENIFVNQYIVIDEEKLTVYRIWNHNYTPETIKPVLQKAGFRIVHTWNSLDGTPYKPGSEWLAVAARKR